MFNEKEYQRISIEETKKNLISQITGFPAVIARKGPEHIVLFDKTDEPRLYWNLPALEAMDEISLRNLLRWIENKHEIEMGKRT